jgi:hypothetical protein
MTIRSNTLQFIVLSLIAAAPATLSGCSSPKETASSRADMTVESMGATTARLDRANAQIDSTLVSLDSLVAAKGGDLRAPYKKFSTEVDGIETSANAARQQAASMRDHTTETFDAWASEAQNINDPAMKEISRERRDQARASYSRMQDASQKAKAAYDPFLSDLRDIRTYLGSDLTSSGVDAISGKITSVHREGDALKSALAQAQQAMNELKSQLASPK